MFLVHKWVGRFFKVGLLWNRKPGGAFVLLICLVAKKQMDGDPRNLTLPRKIATRGFL